MKVNLPARRGHTSGSVASGSTSKFQPNFFLEDFLVLSIHSSLSGDQGLKILTWHSMKYWLVHRNPYFMTFEIMPIKLVVVFHHPLYKHIQLNSPGFWLVTAQGASRIFCQEANLLLDEGAPQDVAPLVLHCLPLMIGKLGSAGNEYFQQQVTKECCSANLRGPWLICQRSPRLKSSYDMFLNNPKYWDFMIK